MSPRAASWVSGVEIRKPFIAIYFCGKPGGHITLKKDGFGQGCKFAGLLDNKNFKIM